MNIRKFYLLIILFMSMVCSSPYALELKADYKIDKNLSQEEVDTITKSYLDVKNQLSGTLRFSLKQEWLRVTRKYTLNAQLDAGASLRSIATTPEMKELLDELDNTTINKVVEEVYLYHALTRKGLKTSKRHTMNNKRGESYVNKQSYWSLASTVNKTCSVGLYRFPDLRMNKLFGCALQKKIEKNRLINIEKSAKVIVQFRPNKGAMVRETEMTCDYYRLASRSVDSGDLGSKYCIRYIDNIPIALIYQAYKKGTDKNDAAYKVYRLVNLNMAPEFDEDYFDFNKEEVCPSKQKKCRL